MVLAGDTDSKERSLSFAESVFKIFIRLDAWNIAFIFTDKHMQRENESAVERFYHVGRPK